MPFFFPVPSGVLRTHETLQRSAFRSFKFSLKPSSRHLNELNNRTVRHNRPLIPHLTSRTARLFGKNIPYHLVRLLDPDTGELRPPSTLQSVIEAYDKEEWLVELVSSEPEAIVRVVNRQESLQKRKEERRKSSNKKSPNQKELQITWSTAKGDLDHKFGKAREILEKGDRVSVILAPKKGQRAPPLDDMKRKAQDVADSLSDIAKEWKEKEISFGGVILFFEKLKA